MEWISAAISFYKATLAVITGLSAPYSNSAIIYKQQGHYAGAIACYNEVLRIDPMAADGLVNRGNTLKDSGHVEAVIKSHKLVSTQIFVALNTKSLPSQVHRALGGCYTSSTTEF